MPDLPPVYIYLMLFCLSVCLFVSNKRETAEPIGPKFSVVPHLSQEKVYIDDHNFKIWSPTKFDRH